MVEDGEEGLLTNSVETVSWTSQEEMSLSSEFTERLFPDVVSKETYSNTLTRGRRRSRSRSRSPKRKNSSNRKYIVNLAQKGM